MGNSQCKGILIFHEINFLCLQFVLSCIKNTVVKDLQAEKMYLRDCSQITIMNSSQRYSDILSQDNQSTDSRQTSGSEETSVVTRG